MDCLDYESENNSSDDVILEDSECEYDSDCQQDRGLVQPYGTMSDLEFIAAHAVDIPVYNSVNIENTVIRGKDMEANKKECGDESDDDEDEDDNDDDDCNDDGMVVEEQDESSASSSDSEDDTALTGKKFRSMLTEEEEESVAAGPPKTKNELLESVLYPSDVTKVTGEELLKVGEVLYRIDHECVVVVQAYFTTSPLNESSMLCHESGIVLGRVHEVFGPITTPYYIVRWESSNNQASTKKIKKPNNNNKTKNAEKVSSLMDPDQPQAEEDVQMDSKPEAEELPEPQVLDAPSSSTSSAVAVVDTVQLVSELFVPGTHVYAAKSRSSFVTPGVLMQQHGKGSDASNAHDEEPPEDELEYSDDEKELAARQERNRAKRALRSGGGGGAAVMGAEMATVAAAAGVGVGGAAGPVRGTARTKRSHPAAAHQTTYPSAPSIPTSGPVYGMPQPPVPMMPYPYSMATAAPGSGVMYAYPAAGPQYTQVWPGYTAPMMYPSQQQQHAYAAYPGVIHGQPQQPLQYVHTPLQQQQFQQLNSSLFTVHQATGIAASSDKPPPPPHPHPAP